jgi:cell wall-associated NlpC family hydrolase
LPFESRVEQVSGIDDNWIQVRLPDGRLAFVQAGDVRSPAAPIDTGSVLQLSRGFLGLPYSWGGTSSFGYDCSGFTQMLMRRRGFSMPRDAHQQEAWAGLTPVERESLEPGDLLFFGPSDKKITHTGMYLGSGEFIHATAHRKPIIQISRLDEPHWTERFVSARRAK